MRIRHLFWEFRHHPLRRLISATGRESSNVYQQPSCPPERLFSRAGDLNIRPQDHSATNTYTRNYSYDKIGNIQTLNHVAAGHSNQNFVRNYAYSTPGNNRLSSFTVGSNSFPNTYNPNGNLTKEGSTRYLRWTHNDKLATFSNQAGSSDPTVYTNYFYNAAGDRIKKVTRKGQKLEVTVYVDGGLFELTYTKPTGGSIDANLHYNTVYLRDGNSAIMTARVGNNTVDSTPAIKYHIEDHLGNSTVIIGPNGNLVNREEFYPFGETSFGAYAFKRYRYNGKEKDEESGLYNYGQRYYAPWLCRFVSVDPIAESYPQLSSYNYAGNKPITHKDLEGLQSDGGDQKKETRKRQNGKDLKDGERTNNDVNYEMHNLPADPTDGQKVDYYYTKGDQRHAQWTYNEKADAWGVRAHNFQELADKVTKEPTSFWHKAKHTQIENIDTPDLSTQNEGAPKTESSSTQSTEQKSPATEVPGLNVVQELEKVHEGVTSDEGKNITTGASMVNSMLDSAARDAQNYQPKYKHSNPKINAPANLKGLIRFTGLATKFLGVTSMIQHGTDLVKSFNEKDYKNAALSLAKVGIDAFFTFNRLANPAILGASLIYNVADMAGFLKF